MEPYETGTVVKCLKGRDAEVCFAVIGSVQTEGGKRYLLISDGRHHPLENPKKKNPIHLQTMCPPEPRIQAALESGELTNRWLRKLLGEIQHQA